MCIMCKCKYLVGIAKGGAWIKRPNPYKSKRQAINYITDTQRFWGYAMTLEKIHPKKGVIDFTFYPPTR